MMPAQNHLSELPQEAKKRLNDLVLKMPIIRELEGEDSDTIFLVDIINWIYAPSKEFPYKPL